VIKVDNILPCVIIKHGIHTVETTKEDQEEDRIQSGTVRHRPDTRSGYRARD
jgi:hypothetical protein